MKKLFFVLMAMTLFLPSFSLATAPIDNSCSTTINIVPQVSASYDPEPGVRGILLQWSQIDHPNFVGYKIVISKNNSQPQYPASGYLKFITDKTTTGYLINNNEAYHDGDFDSYLTIGQQYYFSVTALYTCNGSTSYVPGNVIRLTYLGGLSDVSDPGLTVCDINGDGVRNLSDVSLFAGCSTTFDVNNDGVHNLTDVTLYSSNYSNVSWCQTNFRCAPTITDYSQYLVIAESRTTNISDAVARIWWRSSIGSSGEYRYSKNQSELDTLPWRTDGVSNNPDVTGNMFGSQVDLSGLEAGATYYIQVRKFLGTQYGVAKTLTFVPGNMGAYDSSLDIAETRVDQLALRSARVYWRAVNMSGSGYYRYATSTEALAGLAWSNDGVSNDPAVTGNMNASMVTLNNLQPFTKYYIELKKTAGIAGEISYRYGNPTTINFTTLGGGAFIAPVAKVKVCHVLGNGKTNTLEVAADAVEAHIAHGDKLGACEVNIKPTTPVAAKLMDRVRGRILLQVENHGEAWYVNPKDDKRFYLKDGVTAYSLMREAGLGISNADLAKIPVGLEDRFNDTDTDGDGLADKLESGLGTDPNKEDSDGDGIKDRAEILAGTNPLGTGALTNDNSLVNRLRGRIVLQVQSRGEAWYIDPSDGKRYYMKDGEAAYQIMRFRSLGITNSDLSKISE